MHETKWCGSDNSSLEWFVYFRHPLCFLSNVNTRLLFVCSKPTSTSKSSHHRSISTSCTLVTGVTFQRAIMSPKVPPTPLFPRFAADNSLLLSTEPIFDVSFENDSTEFPTPKPLHTAAKDVTTITAPRVCSMAKEASHDDLYARRVSDARRRSLSRPSSPFLPSTNFAPSSKMMADTSIGSDGEISRVHLAWKSRPPGRGRSVEQEIINTHRACVSTRTSEYPDHQEDPPAHRPLVPQKRGTALSRYLAKSSMNRATSTHLPPLPAIDDQPIEFARSAPPVEEFNTISASLERYDGVSEPLEGEVDPDYGPAEEEIQVDLADSRHLSRESSPTSPAEVDIPAASSKAVTDAEDPSAEEVRSEPSTLRFIPPPATSPPLPSSAANAPLTPGIPFPALADLSDTDGETSMTSQDGLRRSRSEGLVSFFTDFLRGSTSNRAKTDAEASGCAAPKDPLEAASKAAKTYRSECFS